MSIPNVHNWLAGDEFNAVRMGEISDAIQWLRNPPMVHVARRTTTQAIPSNTWTKISFNTLVNSYDPYGFWNAGTPDLITITEPGWYTCEVQLSFVGTATDTRIILGLYKNGFTSNELLLRADQVTLPNSGNQNMRKETTLFFNVGDWMHFGIFCDGAALNTAVTSDAESCGLRVRWVSN
jgi:hypothetical protein